MNERISNVNEKLRFKICELKGSLQKSSRTSRPEIKYMNYIYILLKLSCREDKQALIANMIDLSMATGHIHYSKKCLFKSTNHCIHLPKQYPWLYIKFAEDTCHSICPGSRYWACIWTGLVTEQIFMGCIDAYDGFIC